jgi:hypothetical protein
MLLMQKSEQLSGLSPSADSDSTASGSPSFSRSSQQKHLLLDLKDGRRKSVTRKADDSALGDSFLERTQAGDLFSAAPIVRHPLPVSRFSNFLHFHLLLSFYHDAHFQIHAFPSLGWHKLCCEICWKPSMLINNKTF